MQIFGQILNLIKTAITSGSSLLSPLLGMAGGAAGSMMGGIG
jgi:hypothetical protein